jgi:hypothetical protein
VCGLWTVDCEQLTVLCGLWTVDFGLWTVAWTVDCGLWTLDSVPADEAAADTCQAPCGPEGTAGMYLPPPRAPVPHPPARRHASPPGPAAGQLQPARIIITRKGKAGHRAGHTRRASPLPWPPCRRCATDGRTWPPSSWSAGGDPVKGCFLLASAAHCPASFPLLSLVTVAVAAAYISSRPLRRTAG